MFDNDNQTFETQAKAAAAALVNILTAITPVFLIVAILGIATLNGYLEYLHYSAVIGAAAWVPGFIFASIRFGSGLGGIHLFRTGQTMRGLFFLAVSIGLTFWASAHASSMAATIAIAVGQIENAKVMILTGLWVALLGELMIATYMGAHRNEADATAQRNAATTKQEQPATAGRNAATLVEIPAQRNGATNGNSATFGRNETDATAETQRREIGFRQGGATPVNPVSNGVSARNVKDDGYLVAEELQRAKNNLRAYESKLRNGNGNTETLRAGVQRWSATVAELETKLQQLQD